MTERAKHSSSLRMKRPGYASQSLATPLMPSVAYSAESPDALDALYEGSAPGYSYAREGHPNADVLAGRIDMLEGAEGGLITGSGMAAVTATLLGILGSGDHVLGGSQLYGRSMRLLTADLPRLGIEATLSDPTDCERFARDIRSNTRLILLESISNPMLRIPDIPGITGIARQRDIPVAIDNTFATPRGVRPFEHGADIVIHSVTKLLSGHSDATLGYVACRNAEHRDAISKTVVTLGLTPSPFDCWLAERGLLSFELRYDRAEANARALACELSELKGVRRVIYPQRPDHPDHRMASFLQGDRGGNMVSFEIEGGRREANRLVRAASAFAFAPTLGDVCTTLSHPASSSHRALEPDVLQRLGISEGFFRISVGVEDLDILIGGFRRAVVAATD